MSVCATAPGFSRAMPHNDFSVTTSPPGPIAMRRASRTGTPSLHLLQPMCRESKR